MAVTHSVRTKDGATTKISGYTRGLAVKLFCTECCGWETRPKDCTSTLCPLFPFRGTSLRSQRDKASEELLDHKDDDMS